MIITYYPNLNNSIQFTKENEETKVYSTKQDLQRRSKEYYLVIGGIQEQINLFQLQSYMYNKLTQSQSTLVSTRDHKLNYHNSRDEQTMLKNPYSNNFPMKFPKNNVRKQTSQNMLSQTVQNPEPYSIRIYNHANRSRFFEDVPLPLTQTEKLSRHPQYLFDSYNQRKLSNPGLCHHLSRESADFSVRLRTFEDLGVTNNEKRVFSRLHYKPDPIIVGERELRHNSSLEKVWGEQRRHRDNGIMCEKVVQWNPKTPKREPYKANQDGKTAKNLTYKERYLKSKGIQN